MADFSKAVKEAAMAANDATKPVKVLLGTVTGVDPLTVRVSDKLTLSGTTLIITSALTDDEGGLALAVGDKLALLRVQGGGKYVAIDRVVTL